MTFWPFSRKVHKGPTCGTCYRFVPLPQAGFTPYCWDNGEIVSPDTPACPRHRQASR